MVRSGRTLFNFFPSGQNVRHYVLTHFHSDHTVGLTRHFDSGTIYCTDAWILIGLEAFLMIYVVFLVKKWLGPSLDTVCFGDFWANLLPHSSMRM